MKCDYDICKKICKKISQGVKKNVARQYPKVCGRKHWATEPQKTDISMQDISAERMYDITPWACRVSKHDWNPQKDSQNTHFFLRGLTPDWL